MVCLERTNARYLTREVIPEALDFASIDVSFISLKLIFPALYALLRDGGEVACLIKPQFEAGREKVGKKGVVRDPKVHLEVLENFLTHAKENNFTHLCKRVPFLPKKIHRNIGTVKSTYNTKFGRESTVSTKCSAESSKQITEAPVFGCL